MAKFSEEVRLEVEKEIEKIKKKANIEKVEDFKDVKKIIEKQFDAEIHEIEFINSNTLGMLCANNGELIIFLNRKSAYNYDCCYTALYLLGYFLFQNKYVYIYNYDENCDILGELENKAFYFAEQLLGLTEE